MTLADGRLGSSLNLEFAYFMSPGSFPCWLAVRTWLVRGTCFGSCVRYGFSLPEEEEEDEEGGDGGKRKNLNTIWINFNVRALYAIPFLCATWWEMGGTTMTLDHGRRFVNDWLIFRLEISTKFLHKFAIAVLSRWHVRLMFTFLNITRDFENQI